MLDFVRKLGDRVMGVLSGFDRLVFRGTLRCVIDARGMNGHLYGAHVPMTDFKPYALKVTQQLKEESEWASDVLFRDPRDVLPLTERLVRHSMRVHGAAHVLRFLGRTVTAAGMPRANFGGEIQSDVRVFEQGLRIKHRINQNSAKMYNRIVLRFETTINDPKEFKVFRPTEKDPDGQLQWLRMRKGVADLHRRAQVSQACNDRFATAQAAAPNDDVALKDLAESLCRRVIRPGRSKPDGSHTRSRTFRALNPLSPDDLRADA